MQGTKLQMEVEEMRKERGEAMQANAFCRWCSAAEGEARETQ